MQKLVKPTRTFPDELLNTYRRQGDPAADAVISDVAADGGHAVVGALMRWLGNPNDRDTASQHPALQDFVTRHAQLPVWADERLMDRGMRFFERNAPAVGLTLGCYSLPYCYAAADGARVLWLSQRIHADTRKRLEETGEWVFSVLRKREWASGGAFLRILKIRLMHAAVRWFTLQSGRWDLAWGHPINQEDMAGTNGAFSYIVIRGLRKAGVLTTEADEEAYLHHLNVVGYVLGVAEELLPQNLREAFHLDRAIAGRHFRPSDEGRALTKSLLQAIEQVTPPALRNLPAAQMRFFLGDELSELLGVPDVPFEKRLVGLASALPIFPTLLKTSASLA